MKTKKGEGSFSSQFSIFKTDVFVCFLLFTLKCDIDSGCRIWACLMQGSPMGVRFSPEMDSIGSIPHCSPLTLGPLG